MAETTLEEMDVPLIYRTANALDVGFTEPENRHGQSGRTWIRSLNGIQKEGLVYSAMTGLAWRFASDEGPHLNGRDQAPNPLSFLSVGMIASYMNEITALADARGVALRDLHLTLENFYYRAGSFPKGTMVSGALPPELTVSCEADCDERTVTQLLYDAVAASPLNGLMIGAHTSLFTLTHNERVLRPEHVASLDMAPFPDPGDHFTKLEPDSAGDACQPLAEKIASEEAMKAFIERTPPPAPTLEPGKNLLHLKTTCHLRADGVKEIVREQYAFPSSTWKFLSDEAEGFGGASRAPDAASYIAAGIAFCFMTQLGRYSHMAKIPLHAYRIIQDTHFSKGGASGGTGKAGFADPVETHVYFDTETDDATAQEILKVGERTCFLHAFCRDDVRAKVRYRRAETRRAG